MARKKTEKGNATLMLVTSMLIYSTIGIFRKFIPMSSVALAFSRGLMGGLFLLFWLKLNGKSGRLGISKRKLGMLCLTSVALGGNWILLFEAYNYTSVAVATLCYYMQPTILILISPLVFKEKLTFKKLTCAIISLVGMVLISGVLDGSNSGSNNLKGVLLGLGAAALYTTVVILNKKNPVEDATKKTMVQLLASSLVMAPYMLLTEGVSGFHLNGVGIAMLVVVGLVHTGIAYVMYFGSVQKLPSQTVAVLSYIDPVGAILLACLILGEGKNLTEIIGAILILGATLVSEIRRKK
ncbi:MAG: EamA family transporter [Oscillospiraceae bacterium]|nr:EamA family transporter [Oscillospiraceae bacterium]